MVPLIWHLREKIIQYIQVTEKQKKPTGVIGLLLCADGKRQVSGCEVTISPNVPESWRWVMTMKLAFDLLDIKRHHFMIFIRLDNCVKCVARVYIMELRPKMCFAGSQWPLTTKPWRPSGRWNLLQVSLQPSALLRVGFACSVLVSSGLLQDMHLQEVVILPGGSKLLVAVNVSANGCLSSCVSTCDICSGSHPPLAQCQLGLPPDSQRNKKNGKRTCGEIMGRTWSRWPWTLTTKIYSALLWVQVQFLDSETHGNEGGRIDKLRK